MSHSEQTPDWRKKASFMSLTDLDLIKKENLPSINSPKHFFRIFINVELMNLAFKMIIMQINEACS